MKFTDLGGLNKNTIVKSYIVFPIHHNMTKLLSTNALNKY